MQERIHLEFVDDAAPPERTLAGSSTKCDIDNDGVVSITDFLALLAAWGDCP